MPESTFLSRLTASTASMHRTTAYSWANSTILMGVFTALWGSVATMYIPAPGTYIIFAIIGLVALGLIAGGIALVGPSKRLRPPTPAEESAAAPRGRVLGTSLRAEVSVLAVGFPLLAIVGLADLMAPFGALVVGLHFLPFGWAFQRRFDYLIGGWTIASALVAFFMIGVSEENVAEAWTLVGLAASLATMAYGAQMFFAVRAATASNEVQTAQG